MVDKMAFLKAYNIDEDDFKAADISWEELAAIYDDYLLKEEKLRGIGKDFVNDYLYDIERAGIHSYRYRTKNPGHRPGARRRRCRRAGCGAERAPYAAGCAGAGRGFCCVLRP